MRPPRPHSISAAVLAVVLVSLASAASAQPASVAIASGHRLSAPGPDSATPRPVSTPVTVPETQLSSSPKTSSLPLSLYNQYSPVWGGYVYCVGRNVAGTCAPGNASTPGVEVVEGNWSAEPIASTLPVTQSLLTFVGIGGYGTSDLAAIGTNATITSGGSATFSAWWRLAPLPAQTVALSPFPTIHPLDRFTAEAQHKGQLANGTGQWYFSISDLSTGSSWAAVEDCYPALCTPSSYDSAEWVAGVPSPGGTPEIPPAFGDIRFDCQYALNGSRTFSGPIGDITLYLQNLNVSTGDLVLPSGIESVYYGVGSELWLSYLVDHIDPVFRSSCCTVSPTSGVPGTTLNAKVNLWTVDGFSGTLVGRLALVLELVGPGLDCRGDATANVGFDGLAGKVNYTTSLRICANATSGTFTLGYDIFYVPTGAGPGAIGSLELAASSNVFPQITLAVFSVSNPLVTPSSGTADVGGQLNFSAVATLTGSLSGPFVFSFVGAPNGCNGGYRESVPYVAMTCIPLQSGSFSVGAEVTINGNLVERSPSNVSVQVNPKVGVNVSTSTPYAEYGAQVNLLANATGGDGLYHYAWTNLPIGCDSLSLPNLTCAPILPGNYTVGVNVTDDTGAPGGNATVALHVALPILVLLLTNYSSVPTGFSVDFIGAAAGGFGPFTYSWSGLPSGCSSVNSSRLTCSPSAAGAWTIRLTAIDTLGASNSTTVLLNVTSSGVLGLTLFGWALVGGVVVVAAVVPTVLLIRRRRRRRARGEENPGAPYP